jgi:DNA polymerase-3 subunit gamma/tau
VRAKSPAKTVEVAAAPAEPQRTLPATHEEWPAFVTSLNLTGLAAQIAAQSELRSVEGHVVNLALPASHKHLADRAYADKLKAALERATGKRLILAFEVGEATPASLAAQERKERAELAERTEAAFRDEPFVRELCERFEGRVRSDSIKPT